MILSKQRESEKFLKRQVVVRRWLPCSCLTTSRHILKLSRVKPGVKTSLLLFFFMNLNIFYVGKIKQFHRGLWLLLTWLQHTEYIYAYIFIHTLENQIVYLTFITESISFEMNKLWISREWFQPLAQWYKMRIKFFPRQYQKYSK